MDFSLSIESSKRQSLFIVNIVLILLGYNGVKFDKKVCQKPFKGQSRTDELLKALWRLKDKGKV